MKTLKTLIKIHQQQVDEIKIKLAHTNEQIQKLIKELEMLQQKNYEEIQKYSGTEFSFMLEQYLNNSHARQQKINEQKSMFEQELEILEDQLFEEYAELKKFEITLDRRQDEERKKIAKKEADALEEYSIMKYNFDKNN